MKCQQLTWHQRIGHHFRVDDLHAEVFLRAFGLVVGAIGLREFVGQVGGTLAQPNVSTL